MVFIFSGLILFFFQRILPGITRPDALILVPNLQGIHINDLEEVCSKHKLSFKITDNLSYSDTLLPLTVLQQVPRRGTYVKEHRCIYLTINAEDPPTVKMPQLIDGSVRNAQLFLKNRELQLGKIKYVPDVAQHAVLEQLYQGTPIAAGTFILKGSSIDLEVGAGLEGNLVTVPDVVGRLLEETRLSFFDIGVRLGVVHHEVSLEYPIGTILCQSPSAGSKLKIGEAVNLWVVGKEYE